MRGVDLTSWQGALTTLVGLALFALVGVGVRLLVMMTVQQRRERLNRQINERLRTLIAAYKTLGGSFTGTLSVDPTHLRGLQAEAADGLDLRVEAGTSSDRTRRIRDAVEAALSDIILLGTDEHVRLATAAAGELASGRLVHTAALVVSLRGFIREALDLDPIPLDLVIPPQGPARPAATGGRGGRDGAREGGGGRGGGGGGGSGMAMGLGSGTGIGMTEGEGR